MFSINLYDLKRQFPASIQLYRSTANVPNYTTGQLAESISVVDIQRAIALPKGESLESLVAKLSATSSLSSATVYTRIFIVDTKDLPNGWQADSSNWIIYQSQKYEILSLNYYEQEKAIIFTGREVPTKFSRILSGRLSNYFILEVGAV